MNFEDLQAYHKHITDTYDERSGNHDKSEWHRKTALRLVNELPPKKGDKVLDIATGTGTIAFQAASLVGPKGKVTGVDISRGMLAQANEKLSNSDLVNLEFIMADAEHLEYPENSFDRIYCASAFFCILDPLAALRHWHRLLKSGGALGFHALPETSYFWISEARKVLAKYGYPYLINTATGTMEKSKKLLLDAGFAKVEIAVEKSGYYLPYEKAKDSWIDESDFIPGQYPHPVSDVPPEIMVQCQQEYETRIATLNTDQGVWNDTTMYYIYACKK